MLSPLACGLFARCIISHAVSIEAIDSKLAPIVNDLCEEISKDPAYGKVVNIAAAVRTFIVQMSDILRYQIRMKCFPVPVYKRFSSVWYCFRQIGG